MDGLSLLLILEPNAPTQPCLTRAAVLARYLGARLELLYPAPTRRADSPQQAGTVLAQGWDYLGALRRSILAPDIEISTTFAKEPLAEAIAENVLSHRHALVIKSPWQRHPERSDPTDWQLMSTCPVPLLLTQGKPWQPRPRILAAIDPQESRVAGQAAPVTETATVLQSACAAELHLVSVQPERANSADSHQSNEQGNLAEAARAFDVPTENLHLLQGPPGDALRAFLARETFDVLVMGAPSRRRSDRPALGRQQGLAQSLVGIACDLLSVPTADGALVANLPARRGPLWSARPFWHWLGVG